jgi:hypothetical protein
MTEEHFNEIRDYVNGRLASEHSFKVHAQTFCETFNLKPLFYRELCKRVKMAGMPFVIDGEWRDDTGDPTHLRFSRIDE